MTPIYALYIEHPATGYTSVRTYPSALLRDLDYIALSSQPLVLRTADY